MSTSPFRQVDTDTSPADNPPRADPPGGDQKQSREPVLESVPDAPVPEPVAAPAAPATVVEESDSVVLHQPLVRARRQIPQSGIRRVVYAVTGGAINPGPSSKDQQQMSREDRIRQSLRGRHVTTYLCLKGGIAKTSTCIGVAESFAQLSATGVVACDFNPDAGDLAERTVGEEGLAGVTALARAVGQVESVADLSPYLWTAGRLTVLPGEPDPQLGESLTSSQFNAVLSSVSRYYANIHLDAGTGITHPIMPGILAETDTVVVPAAYSITGARRAAATIDWLSRNGFERLARTAVVALTENHQVSRDVDKSAVRALFPNVAVVVVPADAHVADGAVMTLDQMGSRTRDAYGEIAAMIADRFPRRGA